MLRFLNWRLLFTDTSRSAVDDLFKRHLRVCVCACVSFTHYPLVIAGILVLVIVLSYMSVSRVTVTCSSQGTSVAVCFQLVEQQEQCRAHIVDLQNK